MDSATLARIPNGGKAGGPLWDAPIYIMRDEKADLWQDEQQLPR
jgi:hypothetical protein